MSLTKCIGGLLSDSRFRRKCSLFVAARKHRRSGSTTSLLSGLTQALGEPEQDIGDAAAKNDWGQDLATRVKQRRRRRHRAALRASRRRAQIARYSPDDSLSGVTSLKSNTVGSLGFRPRSHEMPSTVSPEALRAQPRRMDPIASQCAKW
jgi:hypothetical protein